MKIGVIKYNKEYLENINSQLEGLGVKMRVHPKDIGEVKEFAGEDIKLKLRPHWRTENITITIPREYVHIVIMDDDSLENYVNFSSNMTDRMIYRTD